MSTTVSSLTLLQVTASFWDFSDASGHSGELTLLAALRVLVLFWLVLVGGCLVLACFDLVLLLVDNSLVVPCSEDLRRLWESSRGWRLVSRLLLSGAGAFWCLLDCGWC